jgi:hypothetical protein
MSPLPALHDRRGRRELLTTIDTLASSPVQVRVTLRTSRAAQDFLSRGVVYQDVQATTSPVWGRLSCFAANRASNASLTAEADDYQQFRQRSARDASRAPPTEITHGLTRGILRERAKAPAVNEWLGKSVTVRAVGFPLERVRSELLLPMPHAWIGRGVLP